MASSRKARLAVPGGSADGSSSSTTTTATIPHHTHHSHPHHAANSGPSFGQQYISRLVDIRQLDIQSALDQMKTLLSVRPHVVYKTSYYRKQTKNHWYRDDPAFMVLQVIFLFISSIAYGISFRSSIYNICNFTFIHSILWNYFILGLILTTINREISNRNLMTSPTHSSSATAGATTQHTLHVKQKVEWMYAFDIHCNGFFPLFVVLYGIQFFLLPLVLNKSLFALILSNTLYGIAFCWYWYITHLGYRSLPFLQNTEIFLFPIALIGILYALNLIGYPFGLGWNMSRIMAHLYFD